MDNTNTTTTRSIDYRDSGTTNYKEQPSFIPEISPDFELQVIQPEQFLSNHPHKFVERIYPSLVVIHDQVFTEYVQGEERCPNFVNQDLTFLQTSKIPSTF